MRGQQEKDKATPEIKEPKGLKHGEDLHLKMKTNERAASTEAEQ